MFKDQNEYELWCLKLGFTGRARKLIDEIRASQPVRGVRSNGSNVVGYYPSRKMGRTLQFESHRCELSFLHQLEYSRAIEVWDQPVEFKKFPIINKNGERQFVKHVSDFFVCEEDYAEFIECKTEEDLVKLAEKYPGRYIRGEDRKWRCPGGEEYTKPFGIRYSVISTANINRVYVRNVEFLDDYLRQDILEVSEEAYIYILSLVKKESGILLLDLLKRAIEEGKAESDDIYIMILRGDVHVNLSAAPLACPEVVQVFADADSAAAATPISSSDLNPKAIYLNITEGTRFIWDENVWEISNVGKKEVWLKGERSNSKLTHELLEQYVRQNLIKLVEPPVEEDNPYVKGLEIYNDAEPNEQEEADRRLAIIRPYLTQEKTLRGVKKERSIRRWVSRYKEALAIYDYGLAGLLPHYSGRGNCKERLLKEVYEIMDDKIQNDFETITQKGKFAVWGAVEKACEALDISQEDWPSYVTFCKRVANRPRGEQTKKRKGKRAAYEQGEFVYWLEPDTPRHGDRPFQIAHADHTKLDIEMVCPITGINLGRPWASFLVDAYTRRLLAIVVTFDPPSYRSVMLLMRECVRRHGRLPQTIVVDRGKEFYNRYFLRLAARFEITIKFRPAAKPRYGSVGERLFGIANKQFVHLLMGNTQIMKCVRQVTKKVNPKGAAAWPLGEFYEWFTVWGYEFYDKSPHWTLKESPADVHARTVELTGKRRKLIPYDETFRIMTLPSTPKGTAKNVPSKGVKIMNIYYRSQELDDPQLLNKQLPVKSDPFNKSIAYVRIKGRWVRLLSEYYAIFQNCTERQLMIASIELRKKEQNYHKGRPLSAKQLAEFISKAETVQTSLAKNRLLKQQLWDREFNPLLRFVDTATSEMYFAPASRPQQALPPFAENQNYAPVVSTGGESDYSSVEPCGDLS